MMIDAFIFEIYRKENYSISAVPSGRLVVSKLSLLKSTQYFDIGQLLQSGFRGLQTILGITPYRSNPRNIKKGDQIDDRLSGYSIPVIFATRSASDISTYRPPARMDKRYSIFHFAPALKFPWFFRFGRPCQI